jgi:hypothetical protein
LVAQATSPRVPLQPPPSQRTLTGQRSLTWRLGFGGKLREELQTMGDAANKRAHRSKKSSDLGGGSLLHEQPPPSLDWRLMGRRQKKERYAGMARRRRMGGQGGHARTSGFVGKEETNWRQRRRGAAPWAVEEAAVWGVVRGGARDVRDCPRRCRRSLVWRALPIVSWSSQKQKGHISP